MNVTNKECRVYKLYLILLWDFQAQGMDEEIAEDAAWEEANAYFN